MFNYHELTMTESKTSPDRKKQSLVIGVIGFVFIISAVLNAGAIQPVDIKPGTFPGGEFHYISRTKDYGTSMSLFREVAAMLRIAGRKAKWGDTLYAIYHDDPSSVAGGKTRYSVGILVDDDNREKFEPRLKKKSLSAMRNEKLPEVKAGVVHFPFTNGFVSAIIQQLKVIPAIMKYSKEHAPGELPMMVMTCSIQERMCTHYAPLEKTQDFLLGKASTSEYADKLDATDKKQKEKERLKVGPIMKGFKKLIGIKDEL